MNAEIHKKLAEYFSTQPKKTIKKGSIIILPDTDPAGVSFLLDGIVEQYHITPQGNKIVVNIFKPPAFFPMSWAINGTPNTYFYAALTDITYQQAGAEPPVAFLKNNPDVAFDLLSRVYRGTDALLRRLVLIASGMATSRLIFELLIEAYRFGDPGEEDTIRIRVGQSALAARSGLARETVSRELHKLVADGAVRIDKKSIILHTSNLEDRLTTSI